MEWLTQLLRTYPELAIFLTLGLGYWIGSFKWKAFSLGSVTATLLIGVLIGQLAIQISPVVKSTFFLMFLFALGYGVGPQFFRGLKSDGLPQVIFAVVICVLCLVVTYATAVFFKFDAGTAAGLLSGAQTISAVIGVGTETINQLSISPEERKALADHIPVAYAVTYIFGTVGTAWILALLGPKLLGVDLPSACKEYEAKMGGKASASGALAPYREVIARTYRVEKPAFVGKTCEEVERSFKDTRGFIERLRRDGKIVECTAETKLAAGDVIAVAGRHKAIVEQADTMFGPEVDDRELLDLEVEALPVVLTNKDIAGKTLRQLLDSEIGRKFARGVFLRKIERAGHEVPILLDATLDRGDLITIIGAKRDVERIVNDLGYPDRPVEQADIMFVGLGIFVFGALGTLSAKIGGVPLSLSTSGGVLIGGLILGWLRSTHPTFGRIPGPTLWFMSSVGLTAFIAVVGISSGPGFVAGFKTLGASLFVAGVIATTIPMVIGIYLGKYVFKFHPAINFGVNAGARCTTAALGALTEAAKSQVPALGYTMPYAISNTVLIIWGIVIVWLMSR